MPATIINAVAIILGTVVGLVLRKGFSTRTEDTVFTATGMISLVIGMSMATGTDHMLAMTISIIVGGLVGTFLDIEGAIYRFGVWLRRLVPSGAANAGSGAVAGGETVPGKAAAESGPGFAAGFLNASVLFCVGAMALVGSFKAGAEGNYDLILTKSVMDGIVAVMFTGAMGIGVGFSAISVLVYQGSLTLLAGSIAPYVSETMISELSATGGVLIVMIGINLLGLKKIRTGDFLPSLVVMAVLVPLFKYVPIL